MTKDPEQVSLMRDENRAAVAREIDIIAELQRMAIRRLREASETFREDRYLTYDLEDAVRLAEAGRMKLDEIHVELTSEEGYRY